MNYSATVWREPGGGWSARADDVDGAFTAGGSLSEIESNIRESIAVTLDLPRGAEDSMVVELRIRIDEATDGLVTETVEARRAASRASALTADAVQLLRGKGLSVRDVARMLDVTPGRVAQIDKGRAAA